MARVTYLEHSGFAVELDRVILVFDDYRDPSHALHHMLDKAPDSKVIFFISHRHGDHYNHAIFETAQNHDRYYVVSNDVPAKDIPSTINVAGMSAGDVIDTLPEGISVKAYPSTDEGVSFMVTLPDGKRIFHAGDLNDWHWQDDSSEKEVRAADLAFEKALHRITADTDSIDVAMFPVDSRLGSDYARGARKFLSAVKVADFFPMHFGADWKEACDFNAYTPADDTTTRFHCLHTPGKSVEVDL